MTTHDEYTLLNLFKQWSEEMDCNGDCCRCYYNVSSPQIYLDNCPIVIAYDMIYRKIFQPEDWNRKKG